MANSKISGKMVLIEDSLGIEAKTIISSLIESDKASVLCIEKPINKWKTVFKTNLGFNYFDSVSEFKEKSMRDGSDTLIIDSINQLAALTNWKESLRLLDELNKNVNTKRIIIIIHKDCLIYGEKMLKQLRYISDVCISIKRVVSFKKYRAEITTISAGGKIIRTMNDIYYDSIEGKWKNKEAKEEENKTESKKNDIVHNMTSFKITVEKEAEVIKGDLVLPYTEAIKNKNKLVAEPDYDDWDDEDPDDDLCI